jgi:ketosteroid isomerase-like protein
VGVRMFSALRNADNAGRLPATLAYDGLLFSIQREAIVAEAREVMDRVTELAIKGNLEELRNCYSDDATMTTPDQGELNGADAIVSWFRPFSEAFPDARWEPLYGHEAGDTAIDEGYFTGTNTGPIPLPTGETVPATGRQVRLRACDAATVRDGRITSHRFYYDQMEFLSQLGLVPEA